ncbi:Bug family tripartite tricarboxylate transporter substrate binding protein [Roseomonas sp. CCTCC AB2023176]|uniref:Bug family tripartite tricarboxylate transporter substrate binding protein n=1 Tax=Roseomonas sp. CCTCC AB2023176 TaxID=3342640 RepID=UPI0035DB6788
MLQRRRLVAGLAVAGLGATRPATAQEVPRTITLVVPFPAGSVVDIMARPFAEQMRAALGPAYTVVVVNRDGGAGSVGAAAVASARPDGATLFFGPSGMLTTRPFLVEGLPYGWGALEPVCQSFENIFVMVTAANSPFRSVRDVLEAARARPDTVSWGDAGVGTVGHLVAMELARRAGVRMTHVPYRSSPQQVVDTQTGVLSFSMTTGATVRGTDLRVLAAVADERQPGMAEVPTLKEQGFPVNWRGFGGVMAPRGTPSAVIRRLEAACLDATRSAPYRQMAENTGQVAPALDAAAFGARLTAEYENAATFLKEIGLAR